MTPEDLRRIEHWFHVARPLAARERAAYVDRVCGSDPSDLREALTSLLAADAAPGDALDEPALGADFQLPRTAALAPDSRAGGHAGSYRLIRRLASGGTGVVYLAARTRAARELREERVAIKLLRRGVLNEVGQRSFDREQRSLAQLDHPNIARLIDAGTTSDGAPFLVVEYVDGRRIDQWCDARRTPIVERLRLFLAVCGAVHYAHGQSVVHRDIKPSNVLVTQDGTPTLLDFGIARLAGPDASATSSAGHPLTPDFASPEQLRGEALTPATDVFSLGVLLYLLLTGRTPFRAGADDSLREIVRRICEEDPPPPSAAVAAEARDGEAPERVAKERATHPDGLGRALRGDLDTIALTALGRRVEARFASVAALAGAIERHLAGQVVPGS